MENGPIEDVGDIVIAGDRPLWGTNYYDRSWPTAAGVSGSLNGGLSAAQAAASMAEGQQASTPIQSLRIQVKADAVCLVRIQFQHIIEPVTEEQAHIARQAYTDFGGGRHKAGLEFGDCFAYALAKTKSETLLFKGEDFQKTDIASAI